MQTGWVKSNGKWYYLDKSSGKMVVSTTTPDGYAVGPDGAWIEQREKEIIRNRKQKTGGKKEWVNVTKIAIIV